MPRSSRSSARRFLSTPSALVTARRSCRKGITSALNLRKSPQSRSDAARPAAPPQRSAPPHGRHHFPQPLRTNPPAALRAPFPPPRGSFASPLAPRSRARLRGSRSKLGAAPGLSPAALHPPEEPSQNGGGRAAAGSGRGRRSALWPNRRAAFRVARQTSTLPAPRLAAGEPMRKSSCSRRGGGRRAARRCGASAPDRKTPCQ